MDKMQRLKARRMGRVEQKKRKRDEDSDDEEDDDGSDASSDAGNNKGNQKQTVKDHLTHESFFRITKAKRSVRFKHLTGSIEQEEEALSSMYPKHIRDEIEKEKAAERSTKKKLT